MLGLTSRRFLIIKRNETKRNQSRRNVINAFSQLNGYALKAKQVDRYTVTLRNGAKRNETKPAAGWFIHFRNLAVTLWKRSKWAVTPLHFETEEMGRYTLKRNKNGPLHFETEQMDRYPLKRNNETDGTAGRRTNSQAKQQTYRTTNRRKNRRDDKQTEKQTDGITNRRSNKNTE